ncbi:hypothetical protein HMN09_00067900 [Mycena chlorophos]|uniref:Phosphatidylinositol N-acetylglucosaminyltransferase subunit H conserved domain-containing protein n=1 Tax=Mycena chlorophos TaxID=658473 RepID=A0A8H6TW87_MYCCL|nr:hypothetical protein HMN09_00067900 [Mycena chlorophos]
MEIQVRDDTKSVVALASFFAILVYSKCNQVLWESVIVFHSVGIQLETHRGLPWFPPLRVERQFLPWSALQDFVIHEGLQGWNVRYYLAAIATSPSDAVQIHVAFEASGHFVHTLFLTVRQNLLPHFPILLVVYRSVQYALNNAG